MRVKGFRYARNIGAGLLCAALLFTTLFSGSPEEGLSASALSLPYIDQLVSDMTADTAPKVFNILEIVPQGASGGSISSGSIGYYIGGQEPSSAWQSVLASKVGPTARAEYMNGGGTDSSLFSQLEAARILGGSADFPLRKQSGYSEEYPWSVIDLSGHSLLNLAASEQGQFRGTMTETPDGSGNVRGSYIYVARTAGDPDAGFDYDYDNVLYYEYGKALDAAAQPFFFNLTFTELIKDLYLDEGEGTPLYTREENPESPGDYIYSYTGLDWSTSVLLEQDVVYYYVQTVNRDDRGDYQYTETGVSAGYYPVRESADAFAAVTPGTGHFARTVDAAAGYTWAGSGGEFSFVPADTSPDEFQITYSQVYFSGGYSNSNWFLTHVFNMDAAAIQKASVTVTSVTPAEVTAQRVNRADLIVISAGFSLSGDPLTAYGNGNDLSPEMAQAIYEKASATKKCPVIVDYRVATATAESSIQKLARFLSTAPVNYEAGTPFASLNLSGWTGPADADKNFVSGNLYIYSPTAGAAPGYGALVTTGFRTKFENAAEKLGFEAVLREIEYENFILQTAGVPAEERLPLEISMANAIRYIINYGNQRTQSTKTSIKVLEVQPRNGRALTESIIKNNWLYEGHGIQNVEIVTMSTAEFIGRIDDLNETYDMIYFGASTTGFYLSGGSTVFNESVMNGLLYYNIGDSVTAKSNALNGLLNSDWNSSHTYILSNASKSFRLPGNDITLKMANALKDFAAAGYPIVFDDELVTTTQASDIYSFNVSIAPENPSHNTGSPVALKVTVSPAGDMPDGVSYTYTWNRTVGDFNAADGSCTASFSSGSNVDYSVSVKAVFPNGTSTTATSNTVRLASASEWSWSEWRYVYTYSVNVRGSGTPGTLSVPRGGISYTANPNRVDNCTNLYDAMLSLLPRDNVFALDISRAEPSEKSSLLSYLNLSKPSIELHSQPRVYANNNGSMTSIDGSTLYYEFTIQNVTDPTPASTTYDCKLYFDSNADGYYRAEEELSGLAIREAETGAVVSRRNIDGRMCYELKAGVKYTVSRQVPNDYVGILPWKLIVTKNGASNEHIHASVNNYTRVAPAEGEKVPIRVLQIINSDRATTVTLEGNSVYGGLLGQVQDFDITFHSVLTTGAKRGSNLGTGSLWTSRSSSEEVFSAIKDFDMLIIGFADGYGEIDERVADAIFQYITLGKAVLFTHDTTSFINFPANTRVGSTGGARAEGSDWHWGYYFNTVLRDSVGLDYYGISSLTSIGTKLRSSSATLSDVPSLTAAGYNIAYQPKSANANGSGGTLLAKTEGYSGFFLSNFRSSSNARQYINGITSYSRNHPTVVTQVNEGQITTYPFNINTTEFDSSNTAIGAYLEVAVTHKQYYQLNLNSDEIVVWYCLGSNTSGHAYNLGRNDVTNGYYIYTKGNVTYSGVGHDSRVTTDEAMLFINTMIAAYRTSSNEPVVEIKNANGQDVDYLYFTSYFEDDTILETGSDVNAQDERRAVYFKFSEGTTGNKSSSVTFQYKTAGMADYADMDIPAYFLASGGTPSELTTADMYKFFLPKNVIELLGTNPSVSVKVTVTTTVYGRDGSVMATFTGSDTAELRKIQLLELN